MLAKGRVLEKSSGLCEVLELFSGHTQFIFLLPNSSGFQEYHSSRQLFQVTRFVPLNSSYSVQVYVVSALLCCLEPWLVHFGCLKLSLCVGDLHGTPTQTGWTHLGILVAPVVVTKAGNEPIKFLPQGHCGDVDGKLTQTGCFVLTSPEFQTLPIKHWY